MPINNIMKYFTAITLVDITKTGVTRHRVGQEFERDQQRNWETVIQCIGLRAQPLSINGPYCIDDCMIDSDELSCFGEMYSGKQRVWAFTFAVEHDDVFLVDGNPVGGLEKDFEQVPIIAGLTETASFILPIFHPYGAIKNIHFMFGRFVQ